ncbi:T9SS type A sorting domain-containing protein [Flavobacterium sp. Sd200]|uniref:CotH kinase family protein n=1 Tax=Flavobacterium sp. Sd200 TaxID=2692211 RepID=UPI001367A647|nr:CotH kinase family protein [Flavobacterium sp. Sd200]MXN92087.1 T9SS type A sorting domain-containing protein [Flavobacterium sp. Sd200]
MKKNYIFLILLMLITAPFYAQSLVINEIITSNSAVNTDDDGSYEDWVELYNGSSQSINLQGYGLSDNTNPFKWVFPAKTIQPGEFLLVWCSEKNRTNPDLPLHANFKISASGETITLTAANGTTADTYAPIIIPQNYSYGRQPDGSSTFRIFIEPTPGAANTTTGYEEILEAPVFSVPSGFYQDEFTLEITGSAGATILYTIDGSEPDENNLLGTTYHYKNQYPENPGDAFGPLLEQSYITHAYTGRINITDRNGVANKISAISSTFHSAPYYIPGYEIPKSTVVRAKVIKEGAMPSPVITKNYFVSPEGASRFSFPVLAVNIGEDKLFDYSDGIYVAGQDFDEWRNNNPDETDIGLSLANYLRRGDAAEVKANFSYFNNGEEVISQEVGLRIHGGFTRSLPNKSLRVYGNKFGNQNLAFPFFGDTNSNGFETLILRNSGNDTEVTYFLDAFIHKSVEHLNFDTQDYKPVIGFVNGEYWGIINLRERYDKHYFKRVYNINDDELDHLEIGGMIEAKEGTTDHYDNMISFVTNNSLADQANYDYIKTQLDPENFADYFITEIFVDNTDWPSNNVELYRKRTAAYVPNAATGNDGRWRWALKDTDVGFGLATSYTHNNLAHATAVDGPAYPNPEWSTILLRKMLENEEFKNYFINRFADLLNTTFLPSRMQAIFDGYKNNLAPEMPAHIDRWRAMGSMQTWDNYSGAIRGFADNRPPVQRDHIREKFDIQQNINASLNIEDDSQGYISINTININGNTPGVDAHPYPWTGIYFSNIPVTLKAVAQPGYVFSHWTGDINSTDVQVTYTPAADFNITAHFVPTDVTNVSEPIYFWMFDGNVANDTPLVNLDATFSALGRAIMQYQSCLTGYPFTSANANWRKASMERRNSPTEINYIPEANDDLAFANSDMKGLQIKQPFQRDGLQNTMIFNIPSTGYRDIKFAFALKDEGAASAVVAEYSVSTSNPVWQNVGLVNPSMSLTSDYQLFEVDLSSIAEANNNTNLKVRLRFTGNDMIVDNGDRVTFNNISVHGVSLTTNIDRHEQLLVKMYPNPVSDVLNIAHAYNVVNYELYAIDGKLISSGILKNQQLDMAQLQAGVYLLKISNNGQSVTKKIVKQ